MTKSRYQWNLRLGLLTILILRTGLISQLAQFRIRCLIFSEHANLAEQLQHYLFKGNILNFIGK